MDTIWHPPTLIEGQLARMRLQDEGIACHLAGEHLSGGLGELVRSGSAQAFTKAVQKLVPAIQAEDLLPARAGVRAQAVDRDGKLVEDFRFARGDGWLHVLNAPSPAATASLAIGEYVARQAAELVN